MGAWMFLLALLAVTVADELQYAPLCRRSWEKIACFEQFENATVLATDYTANGENRIDWKHYQAYLLELACRCKNLASANGFQYFGLRSYGVCTGLSGVTGAISHADEDRYCVQGQFRDCLSSAMSECIGKYSTEYAYKIDGDGGWSEFGEWGVCNKRCGGGIQIRNRSCSNPYPSSGGAPCEGSSEETRPCNLQPCIGCEFMEGEGSEGSEINIGIVSSPEECVQKCFLSRSIDRNINGVAVDSSTGTLCYCKLGTKGSSGRKSWKTCEFVGIIDGGWSDYGPWSECSRSCDAGTQSRRRTCTNPAPSDVGLPCVGLEEELRTCNEWYACADPLTFFPGCEFHIGDGTGGAEANIGSFPDFRACAAACFEMHKTEPNINGATVDAATGKACYCERGMTGSNSASSWRSCKFGDIVNGGWTEFSDWSICSQSCGGGFQTRHRTCTNPLPNEFGNSCSGSDLETRVCNEWIICSNPVTLFPGCEFVAGDGIGESETNIGTFENIQECAAACFEKHKADPNINGVTVDSATVKVCYCEKGMIRSNAEATWRTCKFGDVVNGNWTDFSAWSTCSQTCNGGTQTRARSCTNPSPNQFGYPCKGVAVESRTCNEWIICADPSSSFPGCKFVLGDGSGGSEINIGTVANPKECVEACFQRHQTDLNINGVTVDAASGTNCYCEKGLNGSNSSPAWMNCKFGDIINGGWTEFSEWSTCSQSCNGGTQSRTRSCTNPSPNQFGTSCIGEAMESRTCNQWIICADRSTSFSGCELVVGDGIGGSEINIGTFTNPSECVATCYKRRGTDPDINGVTVDAATGKSCYCEKGMTGSNSSPTWRTCKFEIIINGGWTEFSEWSTCSQSCNGGTQSRTRSCTNPSPNQFGTSCIGEAMESRTCNQWIICADRSTSFSGCELVVGDGIGGSEVNIGVFENVKECVVACFRKRQTDSNINGVTMDSATGKSCYCEKGMTGSNSSPAWRTCQFKDPVVLVPGCDFVVGDGVGGSEINIGSFSDPRTCVSACFERRNGDPSINGVTVDSATGKSCYCERGMTGSNASPSWKTCRFS